MAYTVTITFPQDTVGSLEDTYDLILTFTVDLAGANQNVDAEDQKLVLKESGELSWEYDMEDSLLVPGEIDLIIADPLDYLQDFIFGTTAVGLATDKKFQVEIKINGITKFLGTAVEDEIDGADGSHLISFKAMPKFDEVVNKAVYDDDGNPLDPLGISTGATETITNATFSAGEVTITHTSNADFNDGVFILIKDVVGMTDLNRAFVVFDELSNTQFKVELNTDQEYISGGTVQIMAFAESRLIHNILEKIFTLVDPLLTVASGRLDIQGPGWDMNYADPTLVDVTNAVYNGDGTVTITHSAAPTAISDGDKVWFRRVQGMTDLNDEAGNGDNGVFTVFDQSGSTFKVTLTTAQTWTAGGRIEINTSDVWGSGTYMLSSQLFGDSTNGIKTLGDVLRFLARDWFCFCGMVHQQSAFFYKLYGYDNGNKQTLGKVLNSERAYLWGLVDYVKIEDTSSAADGFFDAGEFTPQENRRFVRTGVLPWFFTLPGGGASNVREWDGASAESVWFCRDLDLDTKWRPSGQMLAELHFDRRGTMVNNMVRKLTVEGVDYSILQSFDHDGDAYWPILVAPSYGKGTTEIHGVYLGPAVTPFD